MDALLQRIIGVGVIPVIRIDDVETAVPLAQALREGGLNAIEVTVRNGVALDAIRMIKATYPDMATGAGTILNEEQAFGALEAGADFIVSPGIDEKTVDRCVERGVPVVPGCVTPAEIQLAVNHGLKIVKFFPSELNHGLQAINQLRGPFGGVRFLPTGGIDFTNLEAYLRNPGVAAVGGSFMAKAELIAAHDWDAIRQNCRRAVTLALGFELAHVGLNCGDEAEALRHAQTLCALFGFEVKNGNSSVFASRYVEMMKTPFRGQKGHIGFFTNSVERAYGWFSGRGIPIAEETVRRDGKGEMASFYFADEIGGFAVHVVRR